MRGWRTLGVVIAIAIAGVVFLGAMVQFLAPDLAYAIKDRAAEIASGNAGKTYRIAAGSRTGSGYLVGAVLNRYLEANDGYELDLTSRASPEVAATLSAADERAGLDFSGADFAIVNSTTDDAIDSDDVVGVAALDTQYFFVIVPSSSDVRELRDLTGTVNPGTQGRLPTLGERVLDYYGLVASGQVSIVRPERGTNIEDFEAGHMKAATRTQALHSELIENIMRGGGYRLVPIADHDALARALPGARADFIPSGLYGPERRIPLEPVPTITVRQLLVARADVPGRVVRDVLEALYDPLFARDMQYALDEESGQDLAGMPLHPAAELYYHRNDAVTSDRLGRLSFLATVIAAVFAGWQFMARFRRQERIRSQRKLLGAKLTMLHAIRHRIDEAADEGHAQMLIRAADDLLSSAELDNAEDLLDAEGIQSLRSLHRMCWLALDQRRGRLEPSPATAPEAAAPSGLAATAAPVTAS
jgi:TRAP-type uncharacterized transport system substrate-binding protein